MNHFTLLLSLLPLTLSASLLPAQPKYATSTFDGRAYATSQKMDFTNSTVDEINTYYGDVGTKTGTELMSTLYSVISKDNTFVDYSSGVTKWYKITDRNWELSRTITPDTYKFTEDTGNNFYETMLYFKDNTTVAKQINTAVNGFKQTGDSVDWKNKTRPKNTDPAGNLNAVQVDKEHVWVKSHGFSPRGDPAKGAGTDLHHLIAADHNTNNIHNNLYYGVVTDHNASTTKTVYCHYADGSFDISGWTGKTDEGEDCFEPTDQWKGDIARALFYMATRYSDKKDTNTENEPYLVINKGNTGNDDNTHYHGVFHNLEDFLKWNTLDPVSDYEIKRNNLIYKNVQNNRNPFIDHPEWVDRVFDENYVYDATKEKQPTVKAGKSDNSPTDPKGSSSGDSTSTQDSSSTSIDSSTTPVPTDNTSSNTDPNDFSLFGLTPHQTYILIIIVAAVLLVIVIVVIIAIINAQNKKERKETERALNKAARKAYQKTKKKKSSKNSKK